EVTMALKRVPLKVISSLSSVILTPKGYVTRIIEKPKPQEVLSSVAATAAYTFERGLFDILSKISRSDRGEYEVPTAFQQIIEMNGRIMGLEANEWDHISNPEDLWRINMQRTRTNCIDESATIGKGSRLNHCVIGGRVTVGEDSRLEHCLVLAGTVVPARSLHDNSVLYNQKGTELEVVSFSGSIMRSSPYDVRNG
ncbi:MAG TPA: NDP-sugar synthase, partial [Candidatus Hodarchaeales archaeon]|nr:NDP-sugar synthase [Candidatus Hodarchaeales archaeon]